MPKLIKPVRDRSNTFTDLHLMPYNDVFIATLNDRFGRLAGALESLRAEFDFGVAGNTPMNGVGQVYSGTHAQRLATTGAGAGLVVVETDRTVAYVNGYFAGGVMASTGNKPTDLGLKDKGFEYWDTDQTTLYRWSGSRWDYQMGTWREALLADIPDTADLGPGDEGLLFYAEDFGHLYRFNGTDWEFAPGDGGSGYMQFCIEAPNDGRLWALCDGSTGVDRALPDGTTESIDLPNLVGNYIKGGSSYDGGTEDAVQPVLEGDVDEDLDDPALETDDAGGHTHSVSGPSDTNRFAIDVGGLDAASYSHIHTLGTEPDHKHGLGDLTHRHNVTMKEAEGDPHGLWFTTIGENPHVVMLPYMRL
jgi:hypothetical protein